MQVLDQTGSIAESAFRIFRFILQCLIFLVAVIIARWGIRTFLLNRSKRTHRWRNTFSAISIAVILLLLLLRGLADKLLTFLGDAIARLRPESELGWLSGMLVGLYYAVIASAILLLAMFVVGSAYQFTAKQIAAWQARLRASVPAGESNPRFHASRVVLFCSILLRNLVAAALILAYFFYGFAVFPQTQVFTAAVNKLLSPVVRKYSIRSASSLKTVDCRTRQGLTVTSRLEPLNSLRAIALVRLQSDTMSGRLQVSSLIHAGLGVVLELSAFLRSAIRARSSLLAENLFLRKQLAFYQEHQVRPRRLTDAARLSLVFWSKLCDDWKSALVIVKPETLVGWHRRGFKLFWKLKSRPGRPKLPKNIRQLIARMVEENPTWGQGRVADELALKLGILVSPRTVGAYWPDQPSRRGPSSQRWKTFVRNHARSMLACDFLVVVTAGFRQLYVFVLMEIGTRRVVYSNVTARPTATWTLQQFREALPSDHGHKFVIHDRDSIFSQELDQQLLSFGLKVLRTPVRAPQANAYCERLIGTMRREFLDFIIPLSQRHLRSLLKEWVAHYNQARPHSSLGPGIPGPSNLMLFPTNGRHTLPKGSRVVANPILGGLHHEYRLEKVAA